MELKAKHVRLAFAHVRKHGFKDSKKSKKWDVIDPVTGDRFPPKVIRERAEVEAGFENPRSRGGGWPTNDILNGLGFVTVPKDDEAALKIEREISELSLADLAKKALETQRQKPATSRQSNKYVQRSPYVSAYVKALAKGKCDLCGEGAPFSVGGRPYLECHHINQLAHGGGDTIENCVALCPNCHRRMHHVRSKLDIDALKVRVTSRG